MNINAERYPREQIFIQSEENTISASGFDTPEEQWQYSVQRILVHFICNITFPFTDGLFFCQVRTKKKIIFSSFVFSLFCSCHLVLIADEYTTLNQI